MIATHRKTSDKLNYVANITKIPENVNSKVIDRKTDWNILIDLLVHYHTHHKILEPVEGGVENNSILTEYPQ